MTTPSPLKRCLALSTLTIAAIGATMATTYQPTTEPLDVTVTAARPAPPLTAVGDLAPPPHPATVAAREAGFAADRSRMAQWAVDGAAAKADSDARLAAEAAAAERLSGFRQTPANHELSSPRLGGSSGGGSLGSTWDCIKEKESGGNYAETSNPTYRGAYQMGYDEWAAMGGTGDPAAAPPAEQDMRAQMLQAQRGWQPWSTRGMCGV